MKQLPNEWWQDIQFFTSDEFDSSFLKDKPWLRNPGTGRVNMDEAFVRRCDALRFRLGFPLQINSGYRSPTYNKLLTGRSTGAHVSGRAADIGIWGAHALDLIATAYDLGFTGIGIMQAGHWSDRFVHLDDLPRTKHRKRPTVWSY